MLRARAQGQRPQRSIEVGQCLNHRSGSRLPTIGHKALPAAAPTGASCGMRRSTSKAPPSISERHRRGIDHPPPAPERLLRPDCGERARRRKHMQGRGQVLTTRRNEGRRGHGRHLHLQLMPRPQCCSFFFGLASKQRQKTKERRKAPRTSRH